MKVWIVMSKVQEIEARCVDKVFDSKEKADNYVREEEKRENLLQKKIESEKGKGEGTETRMRIRR